ncbi:MAG: ComEC/Rec2 family competence protein, partial [Pedobacter sp.]
NYNILAFTAFILLFYNPFYIWDVGFQLSFISVFGLIYLQPKIYKWLYFKNKWVDKIWSAIALSLAAQLATFPLSVFYFHQFPVYFLLGNIFILLPLIILMYFGIGILILKVYFLAPIFEWIISFTNNGLKFIADLPFSGITSIWLNTWQLLLLSSAIGFLIYALVNYQKRLLFFAICLLIAFQTYAAYVKTSAMQQQKISFFTLRKNYAVAFIQSNKAILVTDLTADDKNFQFFVEPALDKMQVEDVLFINCKQDTVLTNFVKKESQIRFLSYKILMVDEKFNYKKIEHMPKVNSVWLQNNTRKNIKELRQEVIFKELIIDASNKDYMIKTYENEAHNFDLKYHTLKKNNSYLINLK